MSDKLGRNTSNLRRLVVKQEIAKVRSRDFKNKLGKFGPGSAESHKAAAKSTTAARRVTAIHNKGWKGGPAGKPVGESKGGGGGRQRRDARGRFA